MQNISISIQKLRGVHFYCITRNTIHLFVTFLSMFNYLNHIQWRTIEISYHAIYILSHKTHPPPKQKIEKIADAGIFSVLPSKISFKHVEASLLPVNWFSFLTNVFTFIEQSGFFNRAFGFFNVGFVHN